MHKDLGEIVLKTGETAQLGLDWRFTTDGTRIKLKRLHPQIQML